MTDPVAGPVTTGADTLHEAVAAVDPTDDIHASGEYRRHLAAALMARAGAATPEVIP